jgi:hypothetical protein
MTDNNKINFGKTPLSLKKRERTTSRHRNRHPLTALRYWKDKARYKTYGREVCSVKNIVLPDERELRALKVHHKKFQVQKSTFRN